jgi:hypothetical protein
MGRCHRLWLSALLKSLWLQWRACQHLVRSFEYFQIQSNLGCVSPASPNCCIPPPDCMVPLILRLSCCCLLNAGPFCVQTIAMEWSQQLASLQRQAVSLPLQSTIIPRYAWPFVAACDAQCAQSALSCFPPNSCCSAVLPLLWWQAPYQYDPYYSSLMYSQPVMVRLDPSPIQQTRGPVSPRTLLPPYRRAECGGRPRGCSRGGGGGAAIRGRAGAHGAAD